MPKALRRFLYFMLALAMAMILLSLALISLFAAHMLRSVK